MGDTTNNFTKLYLKALQLNTHYSFLRGDINYEDYFKGTESFETVFNFFSNGIPFEDGTEIKLPKDDIIGFYLINKNNKITEEDIAFLKRKLETNSNDEIGNYINNAKNKVKDMKDKTLRIGSKIKKFIEEIESYKPVDYTITESNELRTFKILLSNGDNIDESDALTIFNNLSCVNKYPCIIYCNSNKEKIIRCGNGMSIKFDTKTIDDLVLPRNSINVLNEIGDPITFDFESGICSILTNPTNKNDDTVKKIINFMTMLKLVEEDGDKKIVCKVSFNIDKVLASYDLFDYFINNELASTLFFVAESNRAWCSKDKFYVFFRDFSSEMINGNEIKKSANYLRFLIPTGKGEKSENLNGFTISFTTKSRELIPSFLHKFSRMLSSFSDNTVTNTMTSYKIHNKKITALTDKAPIFFKHETKHSYETKSNSSGSYYSRRCQSQPIIIKPDELAEWERYGRTAFEYPPPEWGFNTSLLFICPNEVKSSVNEKSSDQDPSGVITFLPCCNENGIKSKSETTSKTANRKCTTELINKYRSIGTLNNSLASFLSVSYVDDGSFSFSKYGTYVAESELIKLNSLIVAVLIATKKSPDPSVQLSMESIQDIERNIMLVKYGMSQLPTDIYKQELYDMADDKIIESILDIRTFMDPYLYYRGIEILFDIQLFTFTSDKGRINPISKDEDILQISTLEVPRCKYTHIRFNNKKDIVCIYKNYGSKDKISKYPSCEIIVSSIKDSNNYNFKINSSNSRFFKNIFTLLNKVCHPYEWERNNKTSIKNTCLDDPYSTINWSEHNFGEMGEILGQEIDIYGKVHSFIFKEYVLIIPPSQPIYILNKIEPYIKTVQLEAGTIDVYSGGTKIRPQLKSSDEIKHKFEVTSEDNDGCWIAFNGKQKGLKILCGEKIRYNKKTYHINKKINDINKTIIFMTVINWLWKTDNYDITDYEGNNIKKFPKFLDWWNSHSVIDSDIIFHNLPDTKINCHNMMFPKLSNFDERIQYWTKIWPFVFYRKQIHVNKELDYKIKNFFNVEEIYIENMPIENVYWKSDQFITGLIPTDEDFKRNGDIILTKKNHISDWINRNNNLVFKYKSLHSTNVIMNTILQSYKKMLKPFLYKDQDGKIYIVQNSSKKRRPPQEPVLQIANYWGVHERNPGHDYINDNNKDFFTNINFVEYKNGISGFPEPYINKSNGSNKYLQIFSYDDDETYAAMLPIL